MKFINLIYVFLVLLNVIPVYSQDNADYFPYKKDNYWEYYWDEIFYPDTIVSFSIFDTTDNEGNKIAVFDSYFINPIRPPALLPDSATFIVDSSLNVFSNWTGIGHQEYSLIYKLNGKQGDKWVILGGQQYEMARIREIHDIVILGVPTKTMIIDYYLAEDSTDTLGLVRGTDILAKGFGLYRRSGEGWPGITLKGAVINGILYGDTTKIITTVNYKHEQDQPNNFVLYQNYPNPFNPETNIEYYLPKTTKAKIVVYDILGNEVNVLMDETVSSGYHSIHFLANHLSSGIYFYSLIIENKIETKSMVLLR